MMVMWFQYAANCPQYKTDSDGQQSNGDRVVNNRFFKQAT